MSLCPRTINAYLVCAIIKTIFVAFAKKNKKQKKEEKDDTRDDIAISVRTMSRSWIY